MKHGGEGTGSLGPTCDADSEVTAPRDKVALRDHRHLRHGLRDEGDRGEARALTSRPDEATAGEGVSSSSTRLAPSPAARGPPRGRARPSGAARRRPTQRPGTTEVAEDPAPPSHSEGEGWTHVRDGDSVALRGKGRSYRMTPQSHRRAKIRRTSWTLRSLSGGSVRPKKKTPQVSRGASPWRRAAGGSCGHSTLPLPRHVWSCKGRWSCKSGTDATHCPSGKL